jgi:hypothetical protein
MTYRQMELLYASMKEFVPDHFYHNGTSFYQLEKNTYFITCTINYNKNKI